MALHHTGSDELIYIQNNKVNVTIKGKIPVVFSNDKILNLDESKVRVNCIDEFDINLYFEEKSHNRIINNSMVKAEWITAPMFFEQQQYEIIIECNSDDEISFWHENINVRNKVSKVGARSNLLTGIINFNNDIGYSDLTIGLNGKEYLTIIIEVFPTKIDYKDDYKAIVEDVTKEVYNVAFDFLKKTYMEYQLNNKTKSSPVEFFAIINKIFNDFIKSVDIIINNPHHILEKHHEIMPSHKIKRINNNTIKWLQKHPDRIVYRNDQVIAEKALAVKKSVSYNTKENRLTKYILVSTAEKLKDFKKQYLKLNINKGDLVIDKIDDMVRQINRRCNSSFLEDVDIDRSSVGMSLVFCMAPGYRDLYKYYLMLLHGLSITGDLFHISLKDLALLYEYWCFIKLNSLMKDKYELISQDIIKIQGNGLCLSLVKGNASTVKYRNPKNGEVIKLSYNPKKIASPTISQKPDNVLTLEKKGANNKYEYVFDAKYRINPALSGSDYYNKIDITPGPEVDDINTMHRYRDAIVYKNNKLNYERTMFGAYVLFPYKNEEEYRNHRFYKSIEEVNIGGLPFLPSSSKLVEDMLDQLIIESSNSAFERASLPIGIEEKLAKTDWIKRDVLVGTLRNKEQLSKCLNNNFYYVPASRISEDRFPIRYVAIYQSITLFNNEAGIRYYGEVKSSYKVKRNEIKESPKDSDEIYYRFDVTDWKQLDIPIKAKEIARTHFYTNLFLLQNSAEVPDLFIKSEEEYRLFTEFKRIANDVSINDGETDMGLSVNGYYIYIEKGDIYINKDKKIIGKYSLVEFSKRPSSIFKNMLNVIL